jgi:NADH-quinone oxidoreductase subunit J
VAKPYDNALLKESGGRSVTTNQIAFLALALRALIGGGGVVFSQRPVRAAMCLVLNFLVLAALYFMLGAQMLGISQIMVYAGAIMVLFLFIVMMLRMDREEPHKVWWTSAPVVGTIFGALVLFIFALGIRPVAEMKPGAVDPKFGTPQAIGMEMMTTYAWPFEVASMLLLVGIVASIILAKRRI